MVKKKDLKDSNAELVLSLKADFKILLDDSIVALKDSLIETLRASNLLLQEKVRSLEKRVEDLESGNNA